MLDELGLVQLLGIQSTCLPMPRVGADHLDVSVSRVQKREQLHGQPPFAVRIAGLPAQPDYRVQLRRDLAAIEREQARLTDAIAGAGELSVLVERLRTAEAKRRAVVADLERARQTRPVPAWRDIERRMRQGLADWKARLQGDVADVRNGFRRLLTGPIQFTPYIERGYWAVRFEGRLGVAPIFVRELVTNLASPTGLTTL